MQVAIWIRRAVIVHNNIDTLHINAPTKNVSRHKNALLESLESSIAINSKVRTPIRKATTRDPAPYRSS